MPEKVQELDALIARHLRETGALVPAKNLNYRPAILGWRCSADARGVRGAEGLQLQCAGNDPQIMTSEVPWHEYTATLDVRSPLASLRFDPSAAPGDVTIEWIRAVDSDGTLLNEWRFSE